MKLSEELVVVPCGDGSEVPCSIWSTTDHPSGVVLLGHGIGVDRYHTTVRVPVEVLANEHDAAVVVPEIPLHGVRDEFPHDPSGIIDRWQAFWVRGGVSRLCVELESLLRHCEQSYETLPVVYFGLSLGTQYGIPFLAQGKRIRAAALGLFGSHPPPRTPVMNRFAPEVSCPIYFVRQLDDEVHSAESTLHLYSTLGSADKILDSSPGGHTETSMASVRKACAFLASRGGFVGARRGL